MILVDVVQGSEEWHEARLGIATASQFDRIIQPVKLQASRQRKGYLAELLAERITGEAADGGGASNAWTFRGTELEAEARKWYAWETDAASVIEVGFVLLDEEGMSDYVGGSPDGLVDDDGIVEIKCRSAKEHILRSMGDHHGATDTQVQGLLWITGRAWCDVVHYNPRVPSFIRRVDRDEDYIGALRAALLGFVNELRAEAERFVN